MKIQQPCEDAVSRAKAIEICKKHGHDNSAHYISELPPVTPTRKKGKWVAHHDKSDDSHNIDCSCCDYTLVRVVNRNYTEEQALNSAKYMTKNYCPNCGAEMESDG